VAQVVATLPLPTTVSGPSGPVVEWLRRFERDELIGQHPAVGAFGVWLHAYQGRGATAERWLTLIERAPEEAPAGDVLGPMEPLLPLLRALLCRNGVAQMTADAVTATSALGATSPWRPQALGLLGAAHLLAGREPEADAHFAQAVALGASSGATDVCLIGLSERALLALGRGDSSHAEHHLAAAWALKDEQMPMDGASDALLLAAAAHTAVAQGDSGRASALLARAQRLRPLLTGAIPWLTVQTQLELARAFAALEETESALEHVSAARAILERRPDLGSLGRQVDGLYDSITGRRCSATGWASTLTVAELRLLPLLTTHLTFREIGGRLFVSRNTVKTQAISIYRKLGVSSRNEAIERALELGLVDQGT
jgi:LuxR family maltose regulon positive regulatory protein